jgi:cobalt-zinc-cadmium efflux system membrane fusion protein
MKKNLLTIKTLTVLILFATLSCKHGNMSVETKVEEVLPEDIVEMRDDQIELAGIELGSVEMMSLNGLLKVNGIVTVSPQNLATVCAPLGGFVKSTTLLPGNPVAKGQTLAIIENHEFVDIQKNYLETKNRLDFAEAEYKRHSNLYKEDVYSEQNLQQVTSDYKSLKAQTAAYEQELALIGIDPAGLNEDNIRSYVALVSPISGYVKTANVNIGKYSAPTDIMFEIVNDDNLFLELSLFEKDADKAAKGQNLTFFINNENEEHGAVIYQTGKIINNDRTFKVYARVTSQCKNVLPGMYVNAIIQTSVNKVNALPEDAVVSFDDKSYVFAYYRDKTENGFPFTEYKMIEVSKGGNYNGFTEIILPEGFKTDSVKVVVKGAYNLLAAKKNAGEMAC